jgi:hypothetical protein
MQSLHRAVAAAVRVMLEQVAAQVQVQETVKTVVQVAAADGVVSLEEQELQVKEILVVQETVAQVLGRNLEEEAAVQEVQGEVTHHQITPEVLVVQVLHLRSQELQ